MKIESVEELRALYGYPREQAQLKQLDALERHSIHFIERAPFVAVSTVDINGNMDCSPRGGKPGFVKIAHQKKILIPDLKGNNRLDSLINIIETSRIGCLFMLPGVDETLRVNGAACISDGSEWAALFSEDKSRANCVIEVDIDEVFLHCAKSLKRSGLWSAAALIDRTSFPSMGRMVADQINERLHSEGH